MFLTRDRNDINRKEPEFVKPKKTDNASAKSKGDEKKRKQLTNDVSSPQSSQLRSALPQKKKKSREDD